MRDDESVSIGPDFILLRGLLFSLAAIAIFIFVFDHIHFQEPVKHKCRSSCFELKVATVDGNLTLKIFSRFHLASYKALPDKFV